MDAWISQLPAQSVWIGAGLLSAALLTVLLGGRLRLGRVDMLSLFSACVLGGGVGSRVGWALLDPAVKLAELSRNPLGVVDPLQGGHSSFGAMVGGACVLVIWWVATRRGQAEGESLSGTLTSRQGMGSLHILDVLVLAGLSGLGLARVGCVANGCDFGRVTDGAWALHYPPGSEAYAHHLMTHQLEWGAGGSLGVFPFALYLALGTFVIVLAAVVILWVGRMRPGRVAGWSCMGYLAWRFLLEWTRDPVTVLGVWGAFNIHHLMAIVGILGCAFLLKLEAREHARSAEARRQERGGV